MNHVKLLTVWLAIVTALIIYQVIKDGDGHALLKELQELKKGQDSLKKSEGAALKKLDSLQRRFDSTTLSHKGIMQTLKNQQHEKNSRIDAYGSDSLRRAFADLRYNVHPE